MGNGGESLNPECASQVRPLVLPSASASETGYVMAKVLLFDESLERSQTARVTPLRGCASTGSDEEYPARELLEEGLLLEPYYSCAPYMLEHNHNRISLGRSA
jgi:hypothetical protein